MTAPEATQPPSLEIAQHARVGYADLPARASHSRLRSVLLAVLFTGVCSSFGFFLGLTVVAVWAMGAAKDGDPLPTTHQVAQIVLWCSLVFAVIYSPVLLWTALRGGRIVLRRAGARSVSSADERRVSDVAQEMAIAAGVPAPVVCIVDDGAPNAMAAGSGPHDATVVVTTGLVELLSRQELQAVVAHEVAHIVDGDIRFHTFLAANCSRYASFAAWVQRCTDAWSRNPVGLFLPAAAICNWLAKLSSLAASRQREFLADYTAVSLTRDPQSLIDALTKVAGSNDQMQSFDDLACLFIVDPDDPASDGSTWTDSHPPLRERIRRLGELATHLRTPAGG